MGVVAFTQVCMCETLHGKKESVSWKPLDRCLAGDVHGVSNIISGDVRGEKEN